MTIQYPRNFLKRIMSIRLNGNDTLVVYTDSQLETFTVIPFQPRVVLSVMQ